MWNILLFISKAEFTFFWWLLEALPKGIKCLTRINFKDHNNGLWNEQWVKFSSTFYLILIFTGSDRNYFPAVIFLCLFVHLCLVVSSLVFKSRGEKRVMPLPLITDSSILWFFCHSVDEIIRQILLVEVKGHFTPPSITSKGSGWI